MAKIKHSLFGVVSIAVLIWLIFLTVVAGRIEDEYEWKEIAKTDGTCTLDKNNGIEYQNITTLKQCEELANQMTETEFIYYDSNMHCILFKNCNTMKIDSRFMDSPGATYIWSEDRDKFLRIYNNQKSCNFYNGDFIHYYPNLRFSACKKLGNNHNDWNYIFTYINGRGRERGCSFFKNCSEETRAMPESMGFTYEKQIRKE